MNIQIVGHVCIDNNVTEHASYTAAGSPAMFMQEILGQFPDCDVTIVAPYGADFLPFTKDTTLYPHEPLAIATMVYENTIREGKRTQKCFHYETARPVDLDEQLIELIKAADVICLAPLAPNYSAAYIQKLLQYKKKEARVVLSPQGWYRQFDEANNVKVRDFVEAEAILPIVDVVIVSDQDHGDMAGIAAEWNSRYGCVVVMTEAEKGARVFDGGTQTEVSTSPVPPDQIISSVGAGDIFTAAFIYSFAQSHDSIRAAAFANQIARQCLFCTPDTITIVLPE